ncbi:MAG: F0F1 ATP synthase subunit B [Candidatus Cloacimonetes bacterium]|nr:F0F1 ATP synthase subunit B [Candidatus Cloacimonadota bacterium]
MISVDYTFIIVIINFILLIIVLKKLLYKRIITFLTERQDKISQDIDEAHKSKEEANQLVLEKKNELKESAIEVRNIKKLAQKEANKQVDVIIKDAHERDKKMLHETEEQLILERQKVITEIQSEIAEMVSSLSEKILQEKLDSTNDKKLIDKIVSERGNG